MVMAYGNPDYTPDDIAKIQSARVQQYQGVQPLQTIWNTPGLLQPTTASPPPTTPIQQVPQQTPTQQAPRNNSQAPNWEPWTPPASPGRQANFSIANDLWSNNTQNYRNRLAQLLRR